MVRDGTNQHYRFEMPNSFPGLVAPLARGSRPLGFRQSHVVRQAAPFDAGCSSCRSAPPRRRTGAWWMPSMPDKDRPPGPQIVGNPS